MSAARIRGDRGFTLVEVMAAAFVMAVAFLGLASVQAMSSRAHSLGEGQNAAMLVASEEIEQMRLASFAGIQTGTDTKTLGGVTYTIIRAATPVSQAKKLSVWVAWGDRLGPHTIRVDTVVSQVTNP